MTDTLFDEDDTAATLARVADRHGLTVPELQSRLVKVAADFAADPSRCSFCEASLPPGGRSRFCDALCRKAASRARRRGEVPS